MTPLVVALWAARRSPLLNHAKLLQYVCKVEHGWWFRVSRRCIRCCFDLLLGAKNLKGVVGDLSAS